MRCGNIELRKGDKNMIPVKPIALDPLPSRPLVSILISNYNYASFLGQAIESVLAQTYEHFEIVICDDGSSDSSPEILKWHTSRDSRIKAIYQTNGGQSLALNAAFRRSSGEIICLLDADDIFLPDKLRVVVRALAENPDSGLAVNRMLLVDKAGRYLAQMPSLYDLPSGWLGSSVSPSGPQILPGMPPTSGLSLRRSVAEAIFPLPPALKAYSDTLIQVVAPLVTRIVAMDTPLSEYRVHDDNIAGVRRFTAEQLRNIVSYNGEIWRGWRRYLSSALAGVPSDFPLPSEMAPSLMDYTYARFRSQRDFKAVFRAIPPAHVHSLPKPHQWYWRASTILPSWLFRRSFDFVYGQTRSKMIARRILNAFRSRAGRFPVTGFVRRTAMCQLQIDARGPRPGPIPTNTAAAHRFNRSSILEGERENVVDDTSLAES
jgi:glycosyltransferase involved in cell wall biosynthesis